MKLESLLFKLKECVEYSERDKEGAHMLADDALLEYINNPKVREAYDEIVKGYQ